MPKKQSKPLAKPPATTLHQRFCWLLQTIWKGNRSAMARDLHVSHPAIFLVESGQRQPGRRILEALATHPKVNAEWLFSGVGSPLAAERDVEPPTGFQIPIANCLLPGLPAQHSELLSGESRAVGGTDYAASRYWLRLQGQDLAAAASFVDARAGDLLLLDADAGIWKRNPSWLDGRVCCAKFPKSANTGLLLGHVSCPPHRGKHAGLQAEFFDTTPGSVSSVRGPDGQVLRGLEFDVHHQHMNREGTSAQSIRAAQIVAGAVLLLRPL